jgi:protein-tyrosine phosphatase
MRILMVCLGNICRSPIAEGVLQHKANDRGLNWTVESAGTESYHIGEAPHRFSQQICLQNGIDISDQRARRFTRADLAKYDIIYALATDVYAEIESIIGKNTDSSNVKLFLNELQPGTNASVPDPYYGGQDGYTHVYDLIDQTCEAIIKKYN